MDLTELAIFVFGNHTTYDTSFACRPSTTTVGALMRVSARAFRSPRPSFPCLRSPAIGPRGTRGSWRKRSSAVSTMSMVSKGAQRDRAGVFADYRGSY